MTGYTGGAFPGKTSKGESDAFIRKYDPEGNAGWTRQFGTAEWDSAHDVAVADDGSVYVSGVTEGALPGESHSGQGDAFLRQYVSVRAINPMSPQVRCAIGGVAKLGRPPGPGCCGVPKASLPL